MNVTNDGVESSNLISVNFGKVGQNGAVDLSDEISNDVLFPASKNFPDESNSVDASFDTIDALLNEFNDQCVSVVDEEEVQLSQLSYKSDPIEMLDRLLEQTKSLKTKAEKLKYYLDELNFDDVT